MNNKNVPYAKKGDLVQIHLIILKPEERVKNIPDSTKKVPYEAWIKGFLMDRKAVIGDTVHIKSFIGREIKGTLTRINPGYDHDFGTPQSELAAVGLETWLGDHESRGKKNQNE
jgi:hypothetical protein